MGGGNWSADDWSAYATKNVKGKTTQQVFGQYSIHDDLDPSRFGMRESRDSIDNPLSTPIIVGVDVTGSMGRLADTMVRNGLNTLCTEIYNRKPVTNPHILCMGIGDAHCDTAPLQATQFEADIRIAQQLQQIWLESGGGGNGSESYSLAWYFAAKKVLSDSWAKRRKKGFIFTVGDDGHTGVKADHVKRFLKLEESRDYSTEEVLQLACREWEVFHLVVAEGGTYRTNMHKDWQGVLGERALLLTDHTKMAEVIVSTLQVLSGMDSKQVAASWDGTTALAVQSAIGGLKTLDNNNNSVVRF
jgi:hypothetical protein